MDFEKPMKIGLNHVEVGAVRKPIFEPQKRKEEEMMPTAARGAFGCNSDAASHIDYIDQRSLDYHKKIMDRA
jgi:hypothetical protein